MFVKGIAVGGGLVARCEHLGAWEAGSPAQSRPMILSHPTTTGSVHAWSRRTQNPPAAGQHRTVTRHACCSGPPQQELSKHAAQQEVERLHEGEGVQATLITAQETTSVTWSKDKINHVVKGQNRVSTWEV